MIQKRGTFTLTQDKYEIVIRYEYYSDDGTHEQPPEEQLDITDVWLNDMDITNFYFDYLDLYEEVVEYAREH